MMNSEYHTTQSALGGKDPNRQSQIQKKNYIAQADNLKREEQQIKATNEMMHMIEQMHDKMVLLQNVSLFAKY
jgi:hypothetical protein